ncbi:hypothetical protein BDQ17DRAFT_1333837 [Cyathus striatus]|nr:hypothetical protein BDQ17DRAFT_1333837 [Cyathus striatus]
MAHVLHRLRLALLSLTPYCEVLYAVEDLTKVKVLVKQFNGQRTVCLGILSALLAVYIRQERTYSASLTLGAILFTGRISLEFDGVSEERFRAQVLGIGPASYTVITMLPGIIVQSMLLYEIFNTSSSIASAIVIAFSCYALGFMTTAASAMMTIENNYGL